MTTCPCGRAIRNDRRHCTDCLTQRRLKTWQPPTETQVYDDTQTEATNAGQRLQYGVWRRWHPHTEEGSQ